jgi:hypothetical protein
MSVRSLRLMDRAAAEEREGALASRTVFKSIELAGRLYP